MRFRILIPVILLASFSFVSCKKNDALARNGSDGPSGSGAVVFNVDKTTMLQLVNGARAKGCTCGTTVMPPVDALTWNDELAAAAYEHSSDMNTNNYFSHTGLDGSDPGQRITAAGYSWTSWGENIANGYTSEQAVMNAWLASEGHCKNIMNAGFKEIGAGRSANYWTQDFGSR